MSDEQLSPQEIMERYAFADPDPATTIEDFNPQVREDVEGLMFLGELYDSFDFCGHRFTIKTLRGDEELLAAMITKEFVQTMGQERAWVWALVALSLVSVDGDTEFCPPLTNSKRDYSRARFSYVTGNWYWPLAVHVHDKYAKLLEAQDEAMRRMEDLSKGSPITFTPSAGFSKEEGDSEGPPVEGIMEYLDGSDQDDSKPDSSSSSSNES